MIPDTPALLLFIVAAWTLNVTPGPDMLYVIARSVSEGRRAGLVSALGIAVGSLVHMTAVALGLSSLLLAVPVAFDAIRLAGAAYLVFLGVRALTSRDEIGTPRVAPAGLGKVFRQGVVTNVLNPKVALFFLAFLPQFVTVGEGKSAVAQLVFLGLLFNVSGTAVNAAVAVAASTAGGWIRSRGRGALALQRFTGVLFVGLGLRLALMRRQ